MRVVDCPFPRPTGSPAASEGVPVVNGLVRVMGNGSMVVVLRCEFRSPSALAPVSGPTMHTVEPAWEHTLLPWVCQVMSTATSRTQ